MKKKISLILVLAMILSLAAGCGSSSQAKAPVIKDGDFTIAFCTWIGYAPLYIAREKGFFEKYGINPTLTINEDEGTYAAAMYSNSIQGLGQVIDREVISFASGTPETVILAMDQSSGGDGIIASADINSVEDLKGKTIGLDTSSTAYFFCLTVLQSAGLTEKDVTLIDMDSDSTGPAFMAGQIDAAVTWEPFLSTASDREGGHLLCDSADYPGTILDVLTVRQDLSDEAKQALANAWYDAVDYLKANEDESVKIMAEGLELTVEEAADELSGVSFYGREENKAFIDKDSGNSIFDIAKRAQDFWLELGIISSEIDLDTFISAEYFG